MTKRVLIVGGGTAGWLTAGYLARRLGADLPGGAAIQLVESRDIGILGVGEGTFPTIRRTLDTIGIDEAEMLRDQGIANGVDHLVDTVSEVLLSEDGAIAGVRTKDHGVLDADLYIDCTGFRAELIGKALGVPYRSCRETLFCDRAIAIQVPYATRDDPISSYTISTAQDAIGSSRVA